MRVDRSIDERRDPIESTRAAALFLQQAYDTLGSWPLAITAYNFGPGGMTRAVTAIESDNLVELIGQYNHPYWGFAPKNFTRSSWRRWKSERMSTNTFLSCSLTHPWRLRRSS